MYNVTGNARARKNKRFKLLQVSVLRFRGGFWVQWTQIFGNAEEKPKSGRAANRVVWRREQRGALAVLEINNTDDAGNVETQNNHFSDKCPLFKQTWNTTEGPVSSPDIKWYPAQRPAAASVLLSITDVQQADRDNTTNNENKPFQMRKLFLMTGRQETSLIFLDFVV